MKRALRILRKDLLVLRRSPVLLAVLVAYPLLVALLVGVVAGYASAKPRIALVDKDGLPPVVELGGESFDVQRVIDRVATEVELVPLPPEEAERQLETGRVVAVLTVPHGFVADLEATRSPALLFEATQGGLAPRVTQQVQALVFQLNRELQTAFIASNLRFVDLLVEGGRGEFAGNEFDILGLRRTRQILEDEFPPSQKLAEIKTFIGVAQLGLMQTDDALRATAAPIRLETTAERGRTWGLSAQVQAYGLALTITFLTLLLAAGALAAERDENVIGRLARGLVSPLGLVVVKVALAALVAVALGLSVAVLFTGVAELMDVQGTEPWERLPVLLVGLALAGAAFGAFGVLVGALAREARTAVLVAFLVALPLVLLGLVPGSAVGAAAWVSAAFPFAHAVDFFEAALYDVDPWDRLGREAAWLAALGAVFGAAARLSVRRLLA